MVCYWTLAQEKGNRCFLGHNCCFWDTVYIDNQTPRLVNRACRATNLTKSDQLDSG